jgi:hypothetical protein
VLPCDGGDCVAPKPAAGFSVATVPNERPTVADAARAWYDQAKAAYAKAHGDGPVPMLIVATAGGGIRAAYWTATILERLEKDLETEGGVRPYLFAISGVSGGSVGAAAFEAALAQRDEGNCKAGDAACPLATKFLTEDFLFVLDIVVLPFEPAHFGGNASMKFHSDKLAKRLHLFAICLAGSDGKFTRRGERLFLMWWTAPALGIEVP